MTDEQLKSEAAEIARDWSHPEATPFRIAKLAERIEEVATRHAARVRVDIVRMLEDVEWGGSCADYGEHCPSCHVYPFLTGSEVHAPDCALDAEIKK
jgi:hypothetical protein